jgi:glutaredoxin-like YruB-family protein
LDGATSRGETTTFVRRRVVARLEGLPERPTDSIVMYSTAWCGVCKRARKYMQEQGIPFTEYDVDNNVQAHNEYLLLNPRRSVPTLKIGNEVVVGFSPAALEGAILAAAR